MKDPSTIQQVGSLVDHFAREVGNTLHTVAPQALQVMVAVKQADSIGTLITCGVGFVVFFVAAVLALKVLAWALDEDSLGVGVTSLIVGTVSLIACLWTLFGGLLNQWVWIGAVNPQVAVYHDIIVKVLGPGN